MKKLIVLLIFATGSLAANNFTALKYTLKPVVNQRNPVLHVEATFLGNFNDNVVFTLPSEWEGISYADQIQNVSIKDPNTQFLIKRENNHQLIVKTQPTQTLTVSYQIHQKKNDPADIHETMIRHDVIHATGYGLLLTPEGINQKLPTTISWVDLPKVWKTLSSHGPKATLEFTTDMHGLKQAFYLAGGVRVFESVYKEGPFYLSLYGQFQMKDEDISRQLSQIINSQRQFFNDNQFPYFAVTLIQSENPKTSGSISLTNSLASFMPHAAGNKTFTMLVGHENLHNWLGGRIPCAEDDVKHFWWREGFTEYFVRAIALSSKSLIFEDFIDECNLLFKSYITSPVINAPNSQIEKEFWSHKNIESLPYSRGFMFALYLNALIKKNNPEKSIAHLHFDMIKAGAPFSVEAFKEAAKAYVPGGIESEIDRFIMQGETIDLSLASSFIPIEARKQPDGKTLVEFKKGLTQEEKDKIESFFK